MINKKDVMTEFGINLKAALDRRNISELEFAKRLGLQSHNIYEYERGQSDPKMHRVATIANKLGLTVGELLTGKENTDTHEGEVLPVDEFNDDLIKRLNIVMKLSKINTRQLSGNIGVNVGTISNILTGKRQPRLSSVVLIVKGLGANIEQVIPDLAKRVC